MMARTTNSFLSVAALTMAAVSAACMATPADSAPPQPAAVKATAEAINRSSHALSTGALLWADGTYGAGCVSRSGGWSLRISGMAAMTNPALSVVLNNTACVLTLTSLTADQAYRGTPSFAVGTSYQGSATSFAPPAADGGPGPVSFYGNALLSSASFASNFVMTILYSDNPSLATGAVSAGFVSVTSTSTATSITSPNYTLDLATGSLTVNVDANFIVQSATGTAILTDGSITGEGYFVDQGVLSASPTFTQLDSAYTAATPTAISGANPAIAASSFGLGAVNLTTAAVRTIVIRHVVSGVRSYQTFAVTFSHP